MSERTSVVIARNLREAKQWAQSEGLSSTDWRYISDASQIIGLNNIKVHLVGTYTERSDWDDLLEAIRSRPEVVWSKEK